jgi:hypothetical protein
MKPPQSDHPDKYNGRYPEFPFAEKILQYAGYSRQRTDGYHQSFFP